MIDRTDLMLYSPNTGSRFSISKVAVDSISYFFQSTFATNLYDVNITNNPVRSGRFNGYYMNASQEQYEPGIMQVLLTSQNLNETFEALAVSMSNAVRTGSDETFNETANVVTGSKGEVVIFYRVVWPWISLHCFLVSTGLVFLTITLREDRRHGPGVPKWTSSSLAVLNR